ncbi:karyopherin (importin) beta [Anaeramoeba flamelloides]|uniref:Karyopherin (Importin) beta n=1 Tax=Anaeramoeba flamelloides TaxID=1746091 RepID=A0AAV7Y932_9EUKA|nr:karyopherin (importin) beta [Anaeramoeba flamelloides]
MNENLAEFEDLVQMLLIPNNEKRGIAEEQYSKYLNQDPDSCLKYLLSMINFSENPQVVSLSLVLLRRNIVSEFNPYWFKCSEETQNILKESLFEEYPKQKQFYFKKLIADLLISIDRKSLLNKENNTEEFLIYLFKAIENNSELELQAFMYIIREMCIYNPHILLSKIEELSKLFSNCLSSEVNLGIRSFTTNTVCGFIPLLSNEMQEEYNILVPSMVEVIWALIENGDQDLAENCLKSLIQLASITIKPFKKQTNLILEYMLKINENGKENENENENKNKNEKEKENENYEIEIDLSLKLLAVELLITFFETASGVVVETEGFLTKLVQCSIQLLTNIDESSIIDDFEFDNNTNLTFINEELSCVSKGESILNRITMQLGGELILKDIFNLIPDLLGSEFWNYRFAGLSTLESISEGCRKAILPELETVLQLVLPLLSDSHFRVCYQAINTIEQFSTDYYPYLQNDYPNLILPELIKLFDYDSYLIKANVCACLTRFLQKIEKPKIIIEIVPNIMDNLLKLFANTDYYSQGQEEIIIQGQAISTIAAMSIAITKSFLIYYPLVIKLMKRVLKEATAKEQRLLCGKAIDCVAIIGRATGHENFENDALEVMQIMIHVQENSDINSDDPKLPYILRAWEQIAVVLEERFVPYLEVLMPLVWQQVCQEIDLIVVDKFDKSSQEELIGRQVIEFGDKIIGYRAAVLKSICKALKLCLSLVQILGHHFVQYVDKTLEIILPLTSCIYDHKIRYYCSSLIPELFHSIIDAVELKTVNNLEKNVLDEFFAESLKVICRAVIQERKQDLLSSQLLAISDLIDYYGNEGINNSNITSIIEVLENEIKDSVHRREQFVQKTIEGEKYIDESGLNGDSILRQNLQEENEIFQAIYQIINSLSKESYHVFYPHFQKAILPYVSELLKLNNSPINSQNSFYALSSMILHCETNHFQLYWEIIKENGIQWLQQTQHMDVVQAAAYTLGVCAQRAENDQSFKKDATEIANLLIQSLQSISELQIQSKIGFDDDLDIVLAKDHLISSLGKICYYHSKSIPFSELAPVWLQSLPLEQETDEVEWNIKQLIKYIIENNVFILGENNQNLSKIFQIFAFSIQHDLVNKEVEDLIVKLFQQFKNEYQPNQIESLIMDFNQELKEVFIEFWKGL